MKKGGDSVNGKQHLVSGAALCALGAAGLASTGSISALAPARAFILEAATPVNLPEGLMCGLCYFGGCLLPDIDQPGSLMGRYVHVEAEHRTWTHSIYPLLALFIMGAAQRPFLWAAFGALAHLLMDSFSKCGVCWFHCFDGYRKYGSGAKVRKGWHPVFYTNDVSAWIFCTVLVMLSIWACYSARAILFSDLTAFVLALAEKITAFVRGIPGKAAEAVSGLWPF